LAEVKHLKKILAEEEIIVKIRYLLYFFTCFPSYFGCVLIDVFALFLTDSFPYTVHTSRTYTIFIADFLFQILFKIL